MATSKSKITKKRAVVKPAASKLSEKRDYRTRIIVQFKDDIRLPYKPDVSKYLKEYNVGPWDQLVKKHPGLIIEPLFPDIDPKKLMELIRKAKEMDPNYREVNFFNYFRVACPVEANPETILKDLSSWKNIRTSYLSKPGRNPVVTYSGDEFAHEDAVTPSNPYQKYLNDAPEGVSAKYVWDFPVTGSDGNVAGINFIDIEKGWTLNHNDLVAHGATCLFGTSEDGGRLHGTGVLGIICSSDNNEGCVGIVPNVNNVDVISTQDAMGVRNVAAAILASLNYLGFGDVLLIEDTNIVDIGGIDFSVPIETMDTEFNAIRLATALGIVVIEPGGNGDDANAGIDFDTFELNNKNILKPSTVTNPNPDFKESGAIIVTAAESLLKVPALAADSHTKIPKAPFGSRVDCYGWGENITTLGYGITDYVHDFNGTSGAAAMVAGAVLSMQGMVLAEHGYKFSPGQMRSILRNPAYGTQMSRHITGSIYQLESIFMPDLHKFADQHLNLPPDLYMRDSLSDDGSPHAGAMSWSPDIILKNNHIANPTTAFGIGSGKENDDNISDSAFEGVDNYLYFRALNQGGSSASNAKVTAFWSNPSTVIIPGLLNLIGEIDFPVAIPKPVSSESDTLTVSNELVWSTVPVTGHYCFVAFITCDEDPYFDPKKIVDATWNWDRYYHFIRNNNNVTWRNFNVIPLPPPAPIPPEPDPVPDPEPAPKPDPPEEPAPGQAPPQELPKMGWVHMDFISPGLPGIHKKMDLEIISKLPKKAIGILQAPLPWKREVFRGSPYVRTNAKRKKCYSYFGTGSKTRFEDILFKADSKTPLRLYINIPEKLRNRNYIVAVRQMLEGVEIGRITYMLVPWKKKLKPEKPVKPVIKGKIIPGKNLK